MPSCSARWAITLGAWSWATCCCSACCCLTSAWFCCCRLEMRNEPAASVVLITSRHTRAPHSMPTISRRNGIRRRPAAARTGGRAAWGAGAGPGRGLWGGRRSWGECRARGRSWARRGGDCRAGRGGGRQRGWRWPARAERCGAFRARRRRPALRARRTVRAASGRAGPCWRGAPGRGGVRSGRRPGGGCGRTRRDGCTRFRRARVADRVAHGQAAPSCRSRRSCRVVRRAVRAGQPVTRVTPCHPPLHAGHAAFRIRSAARSRADAARGFAASSSA